MPSEKNQDLSEGMKDEEYYPQIKQSQHHVLHPQWAQEADLTNHSQELVE